jgi:sugar lactone lactonase YvrE
MKKLSWNLLSLVTLIGFGIQVNSAHAQVVYTPYAFTNFAGLAGGWGNADGEGASARFNNPFGIAVDGATNLYIADGFNSTIRKVTRVGTNWVVSTIAGEPKNVGSVDGTNTAARFNSPAGVALDTAGNLYVADQSSSIIRKVTPAGVVTTLAGSALLTGSINSTGSFARFNRPGGVAVDSANNIYVADSGNYTIRKITPIGTNWVVSTIAGSAGQSGSADGTNNVARFGVLVSGPSGITIDTTGNLYVADIGNSTIRKITPIGTNWVVTTIAGSAGQIGFSNGTNSNARFYNPYGIAVDAAGTIYVGDGDYLIRKIVPIGTNWVVTTLAGDTAAGSLDGIGTAAEFNFPYGIAVDGSGNLYVTDQINSTIRRITPAAVVSTLAGMPGHPGSADGLGTAARFNLPFAVTLDSATNAYVADQNNHTIRKITPGGLVTTIAGNVGISGSPDGTNLNAFFRQPSGLGMDGAGNIYVADAGNYKIRKIAPVGTNWVVTTIAGGTTIGSADGTNKSAQFRNCFGLAVDSATNVYVADTYNYTIRKISPVGTNWVTTTIAGSPLQFGTDDGTNKASRFYYPYAIAVDSATTNLYVPDFNNFTIRKITPIGTNWVTTTIAGSGGFFGSVDGANATARFLYPQGIAIDAAANLFVSDGGNATIRRISRSGTNWITTTLGGVPRPPDQLGQSGAVDGIGSAARFNNTWGLAVDGAGNLFIADGQENRIIKGSPLFLFDSSAVSLNASNGTFQLRITGPPGSNVVVEASSNLLAWSPIQTNAMPAAGLNISLPATNSFRSIRALLTP